MFNFTTKNREQLLEIRHGWVSLLILAVLLTSREIAEALLGRGWAAVIAALSAVLWLIIRPWRFGLLPAHTRSNIRLMGIIALSGFAVISFIEYWERLT